LGYLKEHFKMYADFIDDLLYGLHEEGIEIHARVFGVPAWERAFGDNPVYNDVWTTVGDSANYRLLYQLMSSIPNIMLIELKDDPLDICQEYENWRKFIT
jgi:hypothetical protein